MKSFSKTIVFILTLLLLTSVLPATTFAAPENIENDDVFTRNGNSSVTPDYAYVLSLDESGDGEVDAYAYFDENDEEIYRIVLPEKVADPETANFTALADEGLKHVPADPIPSSYDPDYSDNAGAFYPTYGEWVYEVLPDGNGEVRLIAYMGTDTEVVIPAKLGDYSVVELRSQLFARMPPYLINASYRIDSAHAPNITAVTIPEGIRYANAFLARTSVESIHLPASMQSVVTSGTDISYYGIGYESQLREITVSPANPYFMALNGVLYSKDGTQLAAYPPYKDGAVCVLLDTIAEIDTYAFASNQRIEAFDVSGANANFSVADGVLLNKAGTELIRYPMAKPDESYTTPQGVTTIRSGAFSDTRFLQNLTLSEGVTNMVHVNLVNVLKSLHLPSTLTGTDQTGMNVYNQLFQLREFTVASGNPVLSAEDGILYNKDKTVLYAYPMSKTDAVYTMPLTLEMTGENSFWASIYLEKIIIPASLQDFNDARRAVKNVFQEFEVDAGNEVYMAMDGVLYTKDGKVLVFYPNAKEDSAYEVPDTVEYINSINNPPRGGSIIGLTQLTLPPNLHTMDLPLGRMSENPQSFTIIGQNHYARRWAAYYGIPFTRIGVTAAEIADALDKAAPLIAGIKDATRENVSWTDLEQIAAIIEDYDDMGEEAKSSLNPAIIGQLESLRGVIAAINHNDGPVSVEGAPWNIRLEAVRRMPNDPGYNLAQSLFEEEGEVIEALFDVKLTTGGIIHNVPAGETMIVTINGNFKGLAVDNVRIFHVKGDYSTEYIKPLSVTATSITFATGSFSLFGIVTAPRYEPGDVNGDGQINMQDVLLIYQSFRGKVIFSGDQQLAADVDGDNAVNMVDVLVVYQYFRGIITEFPQ